MVSTQPKPASKSASNPSHHATRDPKRTPGNTPRRVFWLRRAAVGLITLLALLTVFYVVDRSVSGDRIGRRVEVAGVDVGNMSRDEARSALEDEASDLLSDPITIQAETETFSIEPTQLEAQIDVETAVETAYESRAGWNPLDWVSGFFTTERIDFEAVSMSDDKVRAAVEPALSEATVEPRNAEFQISSDGQTVAVVPSRNGSGLDIDSAMNDIRRAILSRGDARRAIVPLSELEPDVTTDEAQAMGIKEPVATFTTKFPSGEERVKNIRRISEILDGTTIAPGERFSVNDKVGERTEANGFVTAPVIYDGEFKDDVGGGVSQYATTLYNAAWFAGIPIKEHKAHSFYLSRYPLGREATLSYPHPDLAFVNDYDTHLLLKSWVGESSVTVSLYGTKDGREVETQTGEPYDYKDPETVRRFDETLKPGTEKVAQKPKRGYSVDVTRKITYADGKVKEERITTVYSPQHKIVLYNAVPTPTTAPAAPGTPGSTAPPQTAPPSSAPTG